MGTIVTHMSFFKQFKINYFRLCVVFAVLVFLFLWLLRQILLFKMSLILQHHSILQLQKPF